MKHPFLKLLPAVVLAVCLNEFAIDHLDLVMLFQRPTDRAFTSEDEECMRGSIDLLTKNLVVAIYEGVPILTSANLLRNIFVVLDYKVQAFWRNKTGLVMRGFIFSEFISQMINVEILNKLKENYNIFQTSDKNLQLVLLLPKKIGGEDVTLRSAGFNPAAFEEFDPFELVDEPGTGKLPKGALIYSSQKNLAELKNPLNVPKIKDLFSTEILIPKRIVLFGHGIIGYVADLNLGQYAELLKVLNTINCEIFGVISCFAGGANLLEIARLQMEEQDHIVDNLVTKYFLRRRVPGVAKEPKEYVRIKDIRGVNYIMVVGSTQEFTVSEMSMSLPPKEGDLQYKRFFEKLDEFLRKPTDEKELVKAFRFICKFEPYSAPMVRYPGGQDFFWITEWDSNVAVITYASTVLRNALLSLMARKAEVRKVPRVLDLSDKKSIYVYPVIIDDTIKFPCPLLDPRVVYVDPILISMVQAQAKTIHVFSNIEMPECSLVSIIKFFINEPENQIRTIREKYGLLAKDLQAKILAMLNINRIYVVENLQCRIDEGIRIKTGPQIMGAVKIEKFFIYPYYDQTTSNMLFDVYLKLGNSWYKASRQSLRPELKGDVFVQFTGKLLPIELEMIDESEALGQINDILKIFLPRPGSTEWNRLDRAIRTATSRKQDLEMLKKRVSSIYGAFSK